MELIRKEELKTAIMNFSEVMLTNAEVIKIVRNYEQQAERK